MINQVADILAGLLAVAGTAVYAWGTFRGKVQPNRVSWVLWFVTGSISFAAELSQHVPLDVTLLTLSQALGPFLVVVASFVNPKAYWKVSTFDLLCGVAAALALVLWLVTGQGDIAIFFSILAAALSAIPTVVKSYKFPTTESPFDYLGAGIAGIVTLFTVQTWSFANYGYPAYIVAESAIISFFILTPGRKKTATTGPSVAQTSQPAGARAAPPSPAAPHGLICSSPTPSPKLVWSIVTGATGYRIYRDNQHIGEVPATSFMDEGASAGTHAYVVTAVAVGGESLPSLPVNVLVDQFPPLVQYRLSRDANKAGWHNAPVTVTFTGQDPAAQIASLSPPVTLELDGAGQTATGSAMNFAGQSQSVSVVVNLDQTPPQLGHASWTVNPVSQGQSTAVMVPAVDLLSGLASGEYYWGSDPGQGAATPVKVTDAGLSAKFRATGPPGSYTVRIRACDVAGNWSEPQVAQLIIQGPAATPTPNAAPETPAR